MVEPAILVIGSRRARRIGDVVFDSGFTAVYRDGVLAALTALRKDVYAALIIDMDAAQVDPLEAVLNVRDYDAALPVFLVAEQPAVPGPALQAVPGVAVVRTDALAQSLNTAGVRRAARIAAHAPA
jgi:DNA-binding NtrC family response regulator